MLRSDLYDYSDAYILVKGMINVRHNGNTYVDQNDLVFKIMLHLDHA